MKKNTYKIRYEPNGEKLPSGQNPSPTPAEIQQSILEIQSEWSDAERERRAVLAAKKRWQVPVARNIHDHTHAQRNQLFDSL